MDSSLLQPLNVLSPITLTDLGIVIFLSDEQPKNTRPPIVVTELGRVIDSKLLHARKDSSPISTIELPKLISFRFEHCAKVPVPRNVTDAGIVIDSKLEQSSKTPTALAPSPISVREFGKVISVRLEHPLNKPRGSFVIEFGNITLFNPLQASNTPHDKVISYGNTISVILLQP